MKVVLLKGVKAVLLVSVKRSGSHLQSQVKRCLRVDSLKSQAAENDCPVLL